MPRFVLAFAIACVALVSQAQAAFQAAQVNNDYPTILVHGFTGWGRKELLGFKYWGGNNNDYQERLLDPSYNHKNIMTAEIGPFSSNWDRACELYAQIKGGRVDYGPNHSNKHGHARYGRTFPGLFPQWGTVVNGKLQKVHLVGHSMGGQTIRVLTQLLNKGTAGAPIAEDPASHPLFAGGKDWVHSVTTVSASNQGTTVADALNSLIDKVEKAAISWFGIGIGGIYDAKLDHFNMAPRGSGESVASYVHRIFTSSFFSATATDNARTDMTTAGAKLMNNWVRTLPNVYYYSISSQSTFSLFGKETPNPVTTLLPLLPIASHVAGSATTDAGFPKSWQANDGQVNVPSQLSDGTGKIVPFEKTSTRGVWNQYPTNKNTDHFAITGNSLFFDTCDLFDAHFWVLASLPPHEQLKRRLTEGEHEVHEHTDEMVKYVTDTHRRIQEQAELGTIRMCQENKGLTREQSAGCGRFLEAVAPGTEMAPLRMLRGNF